MRVKSAAGGGADHFELDSGIDGTGAKIDVAKEITVPRHHRERGAGERTAGGEVPLHETRRVDDEGAGRGDSVLRKDRRAGERGEPDEGTGDGGVQSESIARKTQPLTRTIGRAASAAVVVVTDDLTVGTDCEDASVGKTRAVADTMQIHVPFGNERTARSKSGRCMKIGGRETRTNVSVAAHQEISAARQYAIGVKHGARRLSDNMQTHADHIDPKGTHHGIPVHIHVPCVGIGLGQITAAALDDRRIRDRG